MESESTPLVERIRRLVTTQPYGVLATHGEGHAYGSLVAFAFSEDLRRAFFATPMFTLKYRLLSEHDRIALVVDDRPAHPDQMMKVEAVTVTGSAREVPPGPERAACTEQLVARHPQLRSFVASDSSAVFEIQVFRYFHVSRFQEVRQWVPDQS
jgi:nitroimidazol reductase NimA-like FMN-containing flavoprotein (pyridoxamine 5'-phosphate oxidase superfamily)